MHFSKAKWIAKFVRCEGKFGKSDGTENQIATFLDHDFFLLTCQILIWRVR
jgi:hypothetical protein